MKFRHALILALVAIIGLVANVAQAQTIFKKMVVAEGRQLDPSWGFESAAPQTTPAKTPVYGISHAPEAVRAQFVDAGEIPDGIGKASSRTHVVRYNFTGRDGKPIAGWVVLVRVTPDGAYYVNSQETESGVVSFSTDYDGYLIGDGAYYLMNSPEEWMDYYTTAVSIRLGVVDVYERVRIPLKVASVVTIGKIVTEDVFQCVWEVQVRNSTRASETFDLSLEWYGAAVRGDSDGAAIGNARVTIPQGRKLWVIAGVLFPKTLTPGLYRVLALKTSPRGLPGWVISYSGCYANKPAPLK